MPSEWSRLSSHHHLHRLGLNFSRPDLFCRQAMHIELETYFCAEAQGGIDSLLVFFGRVAATGEVGCKAIADIGFIDMLLSLFLDDSQPIHTTYRQIVSASGGDDELLCISVLGRFGVAEQISVPPWALCSSAVSYELKRTRNKWTSCDGHLAVMEYMAKECTVLLVEHGNCGTFCIALQNEVVQETSSLGATGTKQSSVCHSFFFAYS
jgi:hypothetical protein